MNCPICRVELSSSNDNKVKFCPTCRREFYPVSSDKQPSNLNYDLETVSTETGDANPILLSSNDDANSINQNQTGIQREKEKDYLKKHFPHAEITTEYYYPA